MIIEKIFSLGIEKFIIFHHYPSNFRSGLDLTWARSPPYRRSESGETLNEYSLWRLGPGYSVMTVPPHHPQDVLLVPPLHARHI